MPIKYYNTGNRICSQEDKESRMTLDNWQAQKLGEKIKKKIPGTNKTTKCECVLNYNKNKYINATFRVEYV